MTFSIPSTSIPSTASASWQVFFVLKKVEWQAVESTLSEFFEALVVKPVIDGDPNSDEAVVLIFPDQPDADTMHRQLEALFQANDLSVPFFKIEALPTIDWLQHVYDSLKPIEAGRFFVHGKHIAPDKIPSDKIAVVIEAAAAFGTGEHPTTKGCLLMLDHYLKTEKPNTILDMGCGSGILALAAAKILLQTEIILGVDIDVHSIRVAQAHAESNHLADRVRFIHGDGFHALDVKNNAPYALIFGNILAQPLIDMADGFTAAASRDMLLSGFTDTQYPYVEKAYHQRGFKTIKADNLEGWMTLWLQKN
jgi:ribosomal protein L11 methyltransferase